MKLLLSLVLVLTVSLTLSAQQYRLPIGSNVGGRELKYYMGVASMSDANAGLDIGGGCTQRRVNYIPESNKTLKAFLEENMQEMLRKMVEINPIPLTKMENDIFWIMVQEDPLGIGPQAVLSDGGFRYKYFQLQWSGSQWTVPREILEIKLLGLDYYGVVIFISGVLVAELDAEKADGIIHYSTKDSNENSKKYIAPLSIPLSFIASFPYYDDFGKIRETLSISPEYSIPYKQTTPSPWLKSQQSIGLKSGRLTLRTADGYAIFDLLDGSVLSYSDPPPAFLKFPPKMEIVKNVDGFEFSISGAGETPFIIESTTDFKLWEPYPTVELTSVVGKKNFSAKALGTSRFFRLRLSSSPTKQ